MKHIIYIFLSIFLVSQTFSQDYFSDYRKRADSVINYYKNQPFGKSAFIAMAKLNKNYDIPTALQIIDSLTFKPKGDMFWLYPVVAMYLYGEQNIPPDYKRKIREALRTYTPFRGDTENHWMMYYTSIYLLAQTWPDDDGSAWFNGKSSKENFEDAKGWLDFWMKTTTTIGQGEFDSPHYATWYITPLMMLYEFSKDKVMKTRAEIMVNWVLIDFFLDYFDGVYGGAYSRVYPYDMFEKRSSLLTKTAAYFLGDRPLFYPDGKSRNEMFNSLIYALSDFKLPEIIYQIASDRLTPYVSKERKRSRNRIRYYKERNPLVAKYTYMDRNYVLGSVQYNHTEQIAQHSWSLDWKANREKEITTFFTLQPYYSAKDMASLFTSLPNDIVAGVVSSKTFYDKEDKWIGSSPYEKLFQYKNTLIGLYQLDAADIPYKHYDGFFSKDIIEKKEDPSGWIFCKASNVYFAFFPLKPYKWIQESNCDRFRSEEAKNGFILEVKGWDEIKSFDAFQEKIKSNFMDKKDFESKHKIIYKNLDGTLLEFSFDGIRKINGKPDDPRRYKLFDSPYVQSEVGSQKMTLKYKNKILVLDLKNSKIISN